jgi:hypothetical protein
MSNQTLERQLQADLRQLERDRVRHQQQYGRSSAPGLQRVDPDLAALERQRTRLPQRSGATGTSYQRAMAEITLKRYQSMLAQMPANSEGRRLLQRSIDQLQRPGTIINKRETR